MEVITDFSEIKRIRLKETAKKTETDSAALASASPEAGCMINNILEDTSEEEWTPLLSKRNF